MIYLNKNSDTLIPMQAKNSNGGIIDITSATITASFKETPNATSNTFQKTTSSGITHVSPTNGVYLIAVDQANVTSLTSKTYYMESVIDNGSEEYIQTDFCKILGNTGASVTVNRSYGTTAQRPTLTSTDIGYMYYDTDLATVIWWDGTNWI